MSYPENKVSEAYLTQFKDILSRSRMTEVGFVEKLDKRPWDKAALTAKVSSSPLIFAKTPGVEAPQPLIVGKYYDSSDDDDYSPEGYEFIRERALISDPHTHKIEVIYDYESENGRAEYKISDGVIF